MGYFGSRTPIEWRDEHRTPKYIFAYADRRWGPIKVDLAASSENPLCRYWITKDQDSHTACWHKIDQAGPAMKDAPIESGWCNPPYSQITPWIQKAIDEARSDFTTIMLLPTFNGERRDKLIIDHATDIVMIVGRIGFVRPDGEKNSSNTRGSMLVRFAPPPTLDRGRTFARLGYVLRDDIKREEPKS